MVLMFLEEEKLRQDLKFASEDFLEVTQQLSSLRKEMGKKDRTIAMLQKDLGSRSDHDIIDDVSHVHRVNELENSVSEKTAVISDLQDKLREAHDKCDELKAENERMRQKNIAQKRSMQKSYSLPNTRTSSAKRRYVVRN
jgi:peptidoglycan hydrolase CwlO-like protein